MNITLHGKMSSIDDVQHNQDKQKRLNKMICVDARAFEDSEIILNY